MFWKKSKFEDPEAYSKEINEEIKDKLTEKEELKKSIEESLEDIEEEESGLGLADIGTVVIILVVIGTIFTVGLLIATTVLTDGLGALASFQSIFGIVIAGAVVLGLVSLFK